MCRMLETGVGLGKFAGGRPALLSPAAGSSCMSLPDLPILALFFLLMLAGSMHVLAASGHFPTAWRNAGLRGTGGALLLFASMALVAASLIAGIIAIAVSVPWPAIVLGGGAAVLLAPIALQLFSDRFVDGPGALVWLAGGAIAAAALLVLAASLPA